MRYRHSIMINKVVLNPVVIILGGALMVVWSFYFWCVFGKCIKYAFFRMIQVGKLIVQHQRSNVQMCKGEHAIKVIPT